MDDNWNGIFVIKFGNQYISKPDVTAKYGGTQIYLETYFFPSLSFVDSIRDTYLFQTKEMAENAIEQLMNQYPLVKDSLKVVVYYREGTA